MPDYLAPGVYVEEVSFRSKSIEGVSTTTTGFIGPSRFGPVQLQPDVLSSLGDFEVIYGDGQQLDYNDLAITHNYCWHAVRAFFQEGGQILYFSRIFRQRDGKDYVAPDDLTWPEATPYVDGHARYQLGTANGGLRIRARFPGEYGNLRVRFTVVVGQNILTRQNGVTVAPALTHRDTVLIGDPKASPPHAGEFYLALFDNGTQTFSFKTSDAAATALSLDDVYNAGHEVRLVSLTITATQPDTGSAQQWTALTPDPTHVRAGQPDSLTAFFGATPASASQAQTLPLVFLAGSDLTDGPALLNALVNASPGPDPALMSYIENPNSSLAQRSFEILLAGGNDGDRPVASDYEGTADPNELRRGSSSSRTSTTSPSSPRQARVPVRDHRLAGRGADHHQPAHRPRGEDALSHRRARLRRQRVDGPRAGAARPVRQQLRRALLPVGSHPRSRSRARRSTCRRAASWPASTRATTRTAPSTRRPRTRWSRSRSASRRSSTRRSRRC